MKGLNINFSFEKKDDAFCSKNYDKTVTVSEDLYWFGKTEDILDFNTNSDQIIKGLFSLCKKHLANSTKEAEFHIQAYEFDLGSYSNNKNVFRYSLYVSWGKVDRAYIRHYNQDQKEYSQYDEDTKDYIPNLSNLPSIKSATNVFIRSWFADRNTNS